MKIAFGLFKYFPYGGMQRDALCIARLLVARGHRVEFFTLDWQGEREPALPVHVLPARGLANHVRYSRYAEAFVAATGDFDGRVGFNRMPGLDVYYAADSCFVARMEKRPFWHRLSRRYRAFVAAEGAVFAPGSRTHILAISVAEARRYQAAWGTPDARFHHLPPGITEDRRAGQDAAELRASLRAEFGIADDEFLLLAIGSGFRMKGLDRSIRALGALPAAVRARTRLVAIGRDKPGEYQRLARRLGVAERFTILPGRDDIPRFLQGADLLLHPARYENTGAVLIEAVVAGLPVLVTQVCGYAEHVAASGCGRTLGDPFSQAELNAALAAALTGADSGNGRPAWRAAGIAYGQDHDLWHLHARAADAIEAVLAR
ncbi:MAG: glycosyltransferase family 4 protein [Immundisolibacter sp.]|uniref:glycosyltransferase family 4 protein n=1 Tax=Immundisolibacter sp. TaxID=1934948 RepID=UPI003D114919